MDTNRKKLIGAVGAAVCAALVVIVILVFGKGGRTDDSSAAAVSVFTDTSASAAVTSVPEQTASGTAAAAPEVTEKDTAASSVTVTSRETTASKETEKPAEYVEYSFRTKQQFEDHYKKHGKEFGSITKEEYLKLANDMLNSDSDTILHKTEKEDGDDVFFDTETGHFLVLSTDGYIRTFFIPSKGIDYFNRQ